MFGKLLKYEFKTIGKWYLALYAAIAVASIVLGFWIRSFILRELHGASSPMTAEYFPAGSTTEGILFIFSIIAFTLIVVALLVSTFLLIAARFSNNVYGRQGYLTMTLPVTSHQILLSKLLSGVIWYLFAGIALLLAGVLMGFIAALPVLHDLYFDDLIQALRELVVEPVFYQMGLNSILEVPTNILCVFFAISLGQLFKDHRTLLAIVFYFGINMGVGLISFLFAIPAAAPYFFTSQNMDYQVWLAIEMAANLALGTAYYFGSHYILTKKLNLQ